MPDDEKPLDGEAARLLAKVRRLMLIAVATTFIAVAFVLGVIGYRVFNGEGRAAPTADVAVSFPAGAKVLSTAVSADHIVVTIDVGGAIELRTFDPNTLQPLGRLRLEQKQ